MWNGIGNCESAHLRERQDRGQDRIDTDSFCPDVHIAAERYENVSERLELNTVLTRCVQDGLSVHIIERKQVSGAERS